MPQNARITLVTPCLNAGGTIARTLESVRAQKYINLEYFVADGGSTDDTLAIIEEYADIVTHAASETDKNVADALNKAFAGATGEIYGYINADDVLTPGTLAFVDAYFCDHPEVDVLTGRCQRMFADGSTATTTPPKDLLETMAYRNAVEQPSTFWRASAAKKAGPFDDSYFVAFDWEYWNRLKKSGAQYSVTDRILSIYYFTRDNLTSRAGARAIDEMERITRTYAAHGQALARAYRFIFNVYDLHGFYDAPFRELPWFRRIALAAGILPLYAIFGRQAINAYNWNWASKQMRGLIWHK